MVLKIDMYTTRGSGEYPEGATAIDVVQSPSPAGTLDLLQRSRAVPVSTEAIPKNIDYQEVDDRDMMQEDYSEVNLEENMEFIRGADESLAVQRIGPAPAEEPMKEGQGDKPPMDENYGFQQKGKGDIDPKEEEPGKDGAFAEGAGMNYEKGEVGDPAPGDPVTDDSDASVPAVGASLPWLGIGIAAGLAWFFLKK